MKKCAFDPWTLWHLKDYLSSNGRYRLPKNLEQFVEHIGQLSTKRRKILKKGTSFFRARIGPHPTKRQINPKDRNTLLPIKSYSGDEIKVPPFDKIKAGRANAKGIGFLYLASNEKTAIAETRPWKGSLVSLVRFNLMKDLSVVSLTSKSKNVIPLFWLPFSGGINQCQYVKSFWAQIDADFAEPISPEDSEIDYIPTQILAEIFREYRADGIIYKSAMQNTTGYNLVLFDEGSVAQDLNSPKLVKIKGVSYKSEPYEHPTLKILKNALKGMYS